MCIYRDTLDFKLLSNSSNLESIETASLLWALCLEALISVSYSCLLSQSIRNSTFRVNASILTASLPWGLGNPDTSHLNSFVSLSSGDLLPIRSQKVTLSYSCVHDLEEWLWEACEWWKVWGVQYSSPQVNKARADKWCKGVPPPHYQTITWSLRTLKSSLCFQVIMSVQYKYNSTVIPYVAAHLIDLNF